jgi:hypothetical protein
MKDWEGTRRVMAIVLYFKANGRIYWWAMTCYEKVTVAELCSAAIFKQLFMILSVIRVISFILKR